MGKTRRTYRDRVQAFEEEWEPMRRALRRQHQAHWDELLVHARDYADAVGHQNPRDPQFGILVSTALA